MLLDKSKIDANVDKTGPVVWIETPASEITVICIIKEEFHHIWFKLESINLSETKRYVYIYIYFYIFILFGILHIIYVIYNIYIYIYTFFSQLQERGNISKPAKMADLCNCQQISFFNLPFTSCSIPTLLHYVLNITIWLCCLFQEESDPYVLLFCLSLSLQHLCFLSHPHFLPGFMARHY